MVVEINNVKQQEHKRCKYCLGTGMDVGISTIFLLLVCTFSLLFLMSMIEMVILNYTRSLRVDQNGAFSFEESPFEPTWIHSTKFRMHSQLLEAIMSLTLNWPYFVHIFVVFMVLSFLCFPLLRLMERVLGKIHWQCKRNSFTPFYPSYPSLIHLCGSFFLLGEPLCSFLLLSGEIEIYTFSPIK